MPVIPLDSFRVNKGARATARYMAGAAHDATNARWNKLLGNAFGSAVSPSRGGNTAVAAGKKKSKLRRNLLIGGGVGAAGLTGGGGAYAASRRRRDSE